MNLTPPSRPIPLDALRGAMDGLIPATIATCALDGTPNAALISQVNYVDGQHVALSYQFFNKTRENILANPYATVQIIDPVTGAVYRLSVIYLQTEVEGPLFECMKAKLAGIASHAGMQDVFRLLGADIFRVLNIELVPGRQLPAPIPRYNMLAAIRHCCEDIAAATDLALLFDRLLADLRQHLAIEHAMILMLDETGQRLYTVASLGYDVSGVGSEITVGQGVIGIAARERTPIRITHMTSDYAYSRAVQVTSAAIGLMPAIETKIPLPGLRQPRSQLAVPIGGSRNLAGILFVESDEDLRFGYDDEDALATIATQLGHAMQLLQERAATGEETVATEAFSAPEKSLTLTSTIRHYAADQSIFIDQDYLIKGVAGAIFWKLVRSYLTEQRTEFTNRELRLDPAIRLPDNAENLEARLILLQRRLAERCDFLRIEKTGRGRFRLRVDRALSLADMAAGKGG
jgi:adenylate cyclase